MTLPADDLQDNVELRFRFTSEGPRRPALEAQGPRALWYTGIGEAEFRREPLCSVPPDGAGVATLWTGVSRGTERLVFQGAVPPEVADRMQAPAQGGSFPFPVKYGYCAVGCIERTGEIVFSLQPHQEAFVATREALCLIPPDVPPRRALLAAHMETALNALWDSGAGPGDRVVVVGAGVVGLLVAFLAARMPGAEVVAIDRDGSRQPVVEMLGAGFRRSRDACGEADIVFHASASADGLALALSLAGNEGTIVELSWHPREVAVPLGLDFHVRRLRLVSSQVGAVAPSHRPRWNRRRRLAKALELLGDDRLDALITEEIVFDDLPAALPRLLANDAPGLFTAVRYRGAGTA